MFTPDIGTPDKTSSRIYPYISDELRISGKISGGMLKNDNNVGSHFKVVIFISIVLEAFVTSVA